MNERRARRGARRGAGRDAERGAALLVAMVMIFALSILGISSMRGAALERRMSGNALYAATAFHAAESATDQVLDDAANLTRASAAPGTVLAVRTAPLRTDIGLALQSTIVETGTGLAPGYSIGAGFDGYRYRVRGQASIPAVGAAAAIEQGVIQVAPTRR